MYITIKTVKDIPNGVDILFKPPCKFQPCKMTKGDPWSPTTILTEYFECTLNYLFIFFFIDCTSPLKASMKSPGKQMEDRGLYGHPADGLAVNTHVMGSGTNVWHVDCD